MRHRVAELCINRHAVNDQAIPYHVLVGLHGRNRHSRTDEDVMRGHERPEALIHDLHAPIGGKQIVRFAPMRVSGELLQAVGEQLR